MTDVKDIEQQKKKPALSSNMWMYALGLMGINLGIGLINSYQAEFFNKILGANLMIVAAIILAAKIISIVADFVIGNLIDRANFKAGKMRPWILFSAFPLAVFTMISFVFIPFSSDIGKYIYIVFVVVLWNISMTLADIPSQGMLARLSSDGNERSNAAGLANTLKSVALACPGVFFTIIGMFGIGGEGEGLNQTEYLVTAGIMTALGLVFQLLMYFKCKEKVKTQTSSAMSFKEMFNELKSNKMIMIVFLTYILGFARNIGLGIAVQASCILIRDGIDLTALGMGVLRGDECSWAIGITSAISSMVTIVLNPMINKKLGEKKYFIVAALYGFFISFISFLLYVFDPTSGGAFRSIWAILIYQFFMGFSYGPNGYLPMVMTSDIVDYQEWKTGKRTEGTQFAILSMSNKLSNALSVSIGILLVGAIGYKAGDYFAAASTGIVGSPENLEAVRSVVTDSMQNKLWAIYFLAQGLCMLVSCIPMLFYKIDAKTKKQMREELEARRAEAGLILDDDGNLIEALETVAATSSPAEALGIAEADFESADGADEISKTDDTTDADPDET